MLSDKTFGVFISHFWDCEADYYGLLELLGRESSFDWRNHSVPRSEPVLARDLAGIRQALAHRIYLADVVLVVSGKHLKGSTWIQHELNVARELARPIIGIESWRPVPEGTEDWDVPVTMVAWTPDSIVQTIKNLAA